MMVDMNTERALSTVEVRRGRQLSLLLGDTAPRERTAHAVVTWMGAMQAQDLASGLWSLGIRLPGSTLGGVEAAVEAGEVVRTWPMRGTIHLVPPEDVRWMLELTAARTIAAFATRRAAVGLDGPSLQAGIEALTDALRGGRRLTRAEALAVLAEAGTTVEGQAGYHALNYAAHLGVICLGPNIGAQQTFVLLDEWAPEHRTLDPNEALVELAWRYFRSHGPTTDSDFAGWSGLTLTAARAGIRANEGRLVPARAGGHTVWMSLDTATRIDTGLPTQPTRALPGFDEFVLGYKDRSAQIPAEHWEAVVPGGNGVFRSTVSIDGVVVATWTRVLRRTHADISLLPFVPLTPRQQVSAEKALASYGDFVGLPIRIA